VFLSPTSVVDGLASQTCLRKRLSFAYGRESRLTHTKGGIDGANRDDGVGGVRLIGNEATAHAADGYPALRVVVRARGLLGAHADWNGRAGGDTDEDRDPGRADATTGHAGDAYAYADRHAGSIELLLRPRRRRLRDPCLRGLRLRIRR
jgi:hypothetical protein